MTQSYQMGLQCGCSVDIAEPVTDWLRFPDTHVLDPSDCHESHGLQRLPEWKFGEDEDLPDFLVEQMRKLDRAIFPPPANYAHAVNTIMEAVCARYGTPKVRLRPLEVEAVVAVLYGHMVTPSLLRRAAEDIVIAFGAPPIGVPADTALPIPMVMHCPACFNQHIDAPSPGWDNPPHRSHLCAACGCIWRPADVETVGVAAIETRGKADTWTP